MPDAVPQPLTPSDLDQLFQQYPGIAGAAPQTNGPGPISAGLGMLLHNTLGAAGGVVQGAGLLAGSPTVAQAGQNFANRQAQIAARIRPDLQVAPWEPGGAHVVPWTEAQLAQLIPTVAAFELAGRAAPETAFGTGLARALPRAIGGVAADATAKEVTAASKYFTGGTALGAGLGFGGAIQQANQKPGGATVADAAQAAAESPVYAAASVLTPGFLHNALKGADGKFLTRLASNALKGSAVGAIQSGVMAAADQSFRPDLTPQQKLSNVVDATVTGAAVAGLAGGLTGIRALKHVDPNNIDNATLEQTVDQETQRQPQQPTLGLPAPPFYTDAAGRTAEGSAGAEALRGAPIGPGDIQHPEAPQAQPAIEGYSAINQPKSGSLRWAQEYGQEAPTPYAGVDPKALQNMADTMRNYLAAREGQTFTDRDQKVAEQYQLIQDELNRQNVGNQTVNNAVSNDNIPTGVAGAVERGSSARGSEATSSSAPAPVSAKWEDQRDALLKGVSTRKSYADAASLDEMKQTLLTRLDQGSAAKGDITLAERLGVDLNEPAKVATAEPRVQAETGSPTLATKDQITSDQATAPAAPANAGGGDQAVDVSFQKKWANDLASKRGAVLQDLRDNPPANVDEARERLFDALGRNVEGEDTAKVIGHDSLVDLAQKYGILDKDEKYTPAALDIARKGITMDEAVGEAQNRGYTGSDASAFDSGARGQPATLDSIEQLQVYNEGRDWAHNSALPENLKSAAETSKYVKDNLASDQGRTVRSAGIPDQQRNMQFLNQAIDQIYGSTLKPQEQAQLKRLAREGYTAKQLDDTARYFASGRGALVQEQPTRKPYTGEVVDRGPVIRARERAAAQAALQEGPEGRQAAANRSAESKQLIRNYEIKENLKAAHASGDITSRQLISGLTKLQSGDVEGAKNILPGEVAERIGAGEQGVTQQDAQQAIDQATGNWKNKSNIEVHQSAADLPPDLRSQLSSDTVKGFYDRGTNTVHVIADNHASPEDVHATVYHELLGHNGLSAAFGDRLDTLMGNIYRTNDAVRQLADEYLNATGKWAGESADVRGRRAAEEVLAEGSEHGPVTASAMEKITHMVREFGRKIGLNLKYNGADVQAILARAHDAIINGTPTSTEVDSRAYHTAPAINERMQDSVKQKVEDGDRVVRDMLGRASNKLFPHLLQTRSAPDLAEMYGRREAILPELLPWQNIRLQTDAIPNIYSRIQRVAFDAFTKLESTDPKAAERVNNVMNATARGVNGELGWKDHTWLHKDPQAGILKTYVDSVHRDAEALRAAGQLGVYHGLRDSLRVLNLTHMSELLHSTIALDPVLQDVAKKLGDPMTDFTKMTERHNPADALKYWTDTVNNSMSAIEQEFKAMRGAPNMSDADRARVERHIGPANTVMQEIKANLATSAQVPYFHLYREGDHMVAAKLRSANGRADPAAAKAVANALAKAGFTDATIAPELSNPSIYIKVDNESQRSMLEKALSGLAQKGHIEKGSILSGQAARESGMSLASKEALDQMIAQVKANPLFKLEGKSDAEIKLTQDHLAEVENALREAWLNSLPSNSFSRVMAHRETVQGFSKDMVKSTNFRFGVGAQAAGRMWARPRLNNVLTAMNERVREAMNPDHPQHANIDKIQALVNNVRQRDIAAAMTARHDFTDTVRTWSNIFHIGASPAMMLVDGSQLGVLVVPHLGGRHGYSKTLTAMAKAAPVALRVVREALKQGWDISPIRAADVAVTHDVLSKAIPDNGMRSFLEHVIGAGGIDMSSATYAMTSDAGIGSNPKTGRLLRLAAVMPQTTEMMSRMITALAARELHGGKMSISPEDYAMRVINDTLGHYGASSVPPVMSKKGPLGRVGPMTLQFKMFDLNLMWKLYREFHTSFISKAANDEERREARSFLIGHAAVVTALSGTLGLPFAGAMAGVVDHLKELLDPSEHPFDVTAEYRNFLANIFGKDVAEVIAKGAPRAAGFDLSNRIGEEDILPLTQFLTSRQTWSDTMQQWQADAVGAPISMIADQTTGLDQIAKGNVLGGMATMLPTAIRNPLKAYTMSERGYVDSSGMPLPLGTPGAGAILYQLLGLNPEAKAEYTDKRLVEMNDRAALTRESNNLKSQILKSLMTGDEDGARDAIARAQKFDMVNSANPSYAVLPKIRAQLSARQRGLGTAQALGTPVGVNPRDVYARSLVQF